MMTSEQAVAHLTNVRFMAGMRGQFPPDTALAVSEVLVEQGLTVFELTMNSPGALEAMQAVKQRWGDSALVGMGTVLDVPTVETVLAAGADFVVSPVFQPEVVQAVLDADVLMAPGVQTPTEAASAWALGVKLLKLFPVGALGVAYFRAIQGPLGHMHFMINGAMDDDNAAQFLEAGALACGMAGWLTGDGTLSLDVIRQRAKRLAALRDKLAGRHRLA